jgi:hypothetical protein
LFDLAPSWLWVGNSRGDKDASIDKSAQAKSTATTAASTATSATTSKSAALDEDGYVLKIFELLNAFLSSCSVGEFPTRVHLVRLFALQLEQEALLYAAATATTTTRATAAMTKTDGSSGLADDLLVDLDGTSLDITSGIEVEVEVEVGVDVSSREEHRLRLARLQRRVGHVASGMWRYYEQFLSTVRTFQDQLREPIETRLKGEVKIGKWDQLSTYGLIEHSEKIHRKLNKVGQ